MVDFICRHNKIKRDCSACNSCNAVYDSAFAQGVNHGKHNVQCLFRTFYNNWGNRILDDCGENKDMGFRPNQGYEGITKNSLDIIKVTKQCNA